MLGIDLSERMLARAAADTTDERVEYERQNLEVLDLPDAAFDLAYSSLTLHYLADLDNVLAVLRRALVPGAAFVFSQEHPIYTAPRRPGFLTDASGATTWPLDGYLVEGPRTTDWLAPGVVKQHRTIGTLVAALPTKRLRPRRPGGMATRRAAARRPPRLGSRARPPDVPAREDDRRLTSRATTTSRRRGRRSEDPQAVVVALSAMDFPPNLMDDPYYHLAQTGPYAPEIGSALITMVEPHVGHEHGYNRWYEDDHFIAGAMAFPWMWAGRRWVAPVPYQKVRYPADSVIAQPLEAGKYISIYWITEGQYENHLRSAVGTNHRLFADDRVFMQRDHTFTSFQKYRGPIYRDGRRTSRHPRLALPLQRARGRGHRLPRRRLAREDARLAAHRAGPRCVLARRPRHRLPADAAPW